MIARCISQLRLASLRNRNRIFLLVDQKHTYNLSIDYNRCAEMVYTILWPTRTTTSSKLIIHIWFLLEFEYFYKSTAGNGGGGTASQ